MCCLDYSYQKYQLNLYYQTLNEVENEDEIFVNVIKPIDINSLVGLLTDAKKSLC